MDIKLFSFLNKNENAAFAGSKRMIADCANSFSPVEEKFKNFSSPKRMMLAVSQALRSADAVIIAVQSSAYNSIKKIICAAFNIECVQNEEIYAALLPAFEKKQISKAAFESNSLFPANADIFPVSDFIYCGFSVTSGAQSIVVLPLDEIKTAEVVFGSLYDFLGSAADIENKEDISKLKCARLTAKIVSLLKRSESRLAFSELGGVQLIKEGLELVGNDSGNIFLAEKPAPRSAMQPAQEYIVSVAQKAREACKTEYACAVSSAFASNTDDSTFIYYAVADENETFVSKLYIREDETPKDLTRAAVEGVLLSCLNKITANMNAKKNENRRSDRLFRQKIAVIVAGALVGATGISAILAILLN